MHIVILSGGVGSRLWPVSRDGHPKPFIKIDGADSILQKTLKRSMALPLVESIVNVTNAELLFKIKDEYSSIPMAPQLKLHYILEPFGKNTAAAIALSTLKIEQLYGEDAILLILPSDHLISKQQAFNEAVLKAEALARDGKIVTFGITPTSPETGYGYIQAEGLSVKKFLEKPSLESAMAYLASGDYLWNAGMFCFKAGVMLQEMAAYCPDILSSARSCLGASKVSEAVHGNETHIDSTTFAEVRSDSIDYAIMEKSDKIAVIACDIGWSDVGTWSHMGDLTSKDINNNSIKGEVVMDGVTNCHIEANDRVIGAVGVDNLIIIDTADALLVAQKNKAQDVKNIYNALKKRNHASATVHKTVHRPWGSYTVLNEGPNFKIKKIEVNPSAHLSLQMHNHRSEHWVVVSGVAKVINGDKELLLNVSESTYIPAKHKHRLSNPSADKLIIIEVQTGDYLEEDDIIRFDDVYGRIS